jgi:riboflavin kinase/FMN adenylyltransferase
MQLKQASADLALPLVVIVFEPQPQEFFQPNGAPPRLMLWREKYEAFRAEGVDGMVCLRFDARLASLSPRAFVEEVLVRGLGVRHLAVGEDFRFGKGRTGNYALLEVMGEEFGFKVRRAETFCIDGERVSSTRVRQALAKGDFETAQRLLGRRYSLGGRVVHGSKQGRTLGFATANINLYRREPPLQGIFAVQIDGLTDGKLDGVSYIGARHITGRAQSLLEVHVLDYNEDCYGRHIHVEFIEKLRNDRQFDSLEALKLQIAQDAEYARHVLGKPMSILRKGAA